MCNKTIIKKSLSALLAILVIFACTNITFASEISSTDENLLSRGFPRSIVASMSKEAKDELNKGSSTFESATLQYYNEETGQSQNCQFVNGQMPVMPRGQIKETHLRLEWIISKNLDGSRRVMFMYYWKSLPMNRWQDPIGVSWDGSMYSMRSGSFSKADNYYYYLLNGDSTERSAVQSLEHSYADSNANGVVWYADLKGYAPGMAVTSLNGYAVFDLVSKGVTADSKLWGHYVHNKLTGSASIGIPNIGSFSVTGGSDYDEMGTDLPFVAE